MSALLPFRDREHAAELLARALAHHRGRHPLVLAVPRGAVPMGRVIADALGGDLDIVQVRKLGAPFNPEFAIGAVDESGWRCLSPDLSASGTDPADVDQMTQREVERMRQRRIQWSAGHAASDPAGRTVIVVEDDEVAALLSQPSARHGSATTAAHTAAFQHVRDQVLLDAAALQGQAAASESCRQHP